MIDAAAEKLLAVSDAALGHLDVDALLNELLDRIRELLDADTCAFLLLDAESGRLVARAARGLEEEVRRRVSIPLGAGFAGRVASTRRPLSVTDLARAGLVNPLLREKGVRALVGAPLLAHGKVLGVVHAGRLEKRRFTKADERLLQLAADRAALGLERAMLYDELVSLNRLKDNFIAFASHELRNPAAALAMIAGTLDSRGEKLTQKQLASLIASLAEQAGRLTQLIDQLLDISRLEAGAIPIVPEPMFLRPHVEAVVSAVAADRASEIELAIADDLEVVADPRALDRIVSNLVTNACRYGESPIRVAAELRDRHFRLRVEDCGNGVPPDFVPHLFARFTRGAEVARGGRQGAGLGLAIAQAFATAHGGSVVYRAASPRGASFEVVLPRRPRGAVRAAAK